MKVSEELSLTWRDVSERITIERALRHQERINLDQQRELLEQKLKASLTAVAVAVAHEIQQPLAAILLKYKLAGRELAAVPTDAGAAKLSGLLRSLHDDAEQVAATMEQMRMLLRNVDTAHSSLDLAACLESTLIYLRSEIKDLRVQLNQRGLDQACPMQGDGAQLQMAVVNLIRNALEAMADQPGTNRRLLLQLQRQPERLRVVVADSGRGSPADFRNDSIWQVFNSTKANGMGLGPFLAQTAAANHNGDLRIGRSAELGGAEVAIELPLSAAAGSPIQGPGSPETGKQQPITQSRTSA